MNITGVQDQRFLMPKSFLSVFRKWSYFFLRVEFADQQTLLNLPIVPVALLNLTPSVKVSAAWNTYSIHFVKRDLFS